MLRAALGLWRGFHDGTVSAAESGRRGAELKGAWTEHLAPRELSDPDNQRLLDGLGWHHERGNLVRFLDDPSIPPTNNAAERALRPAVIARKVSQCSKTWDGAEAFAAFLILPRAQELVGSDWAEHTLVALVRNVARNARRLHAHARPHTSETGTVEALRANRELAEELITREWLNRMAEADPRRRALAATAIGVRGDQGTEALHRLLACMDDRHSTRAGIFCFRVRTGSKRSPLSSSRFSAAFG